MFRRCIATKNLLFLFLLSLGGLNVQLGFVDGCHEAERQALLKFKQSFINLTYGVSSWEGMDCYNWDGVGCDNVTASVNRLDLHNPGCDPLVPRYVLMASKLDPSLLELRHLNYLDLSCIDFNLSQIPRFIGSFKHLRYLNMSFSKFSGVVPSQLSNLTRLKTLDLSKSLYFDGTLSSDLNWASTLIKLQYLNLNMMLISKSRDSIHPFTRLTKLPSLLSLQLAYCEIGMIPNSAIYNSTWLSRIQHLDLWGNNLKGPHSHVFSNMTSLRYLNLGQNLFNGTLPLWLRNMNKLEYLNLDYNAFDGTKGGSIVGILENLCKLKELHLVASFTEGEMGVNHNFSKCIAYDLEILDLTDNMITGTLPTWLGEFKYLTTLSMRYNAIVGQIPKWVVNLSSLATLDLSFNSLNGQIPTSIGNLSSLERLDLSQNSLNGQIPTSIENLSSLKYLDLSRNSLNGQIPTNFLSLGFLLLSNNNLSGTIPHGLGRCRSLVRIDLSSNCLRGSVSKSHLANLSGLHSLDLSFNPLNLNLSSNWSPSFQLNKFHMRSCNIKAPIPRWIGEQRNLFELDFSNNMMFGELVPRFLSTQLRLIDISHNQITGPITYFSSPYLETIDLSYNLLSGPFLRDAPSGKNFDIHGTPNLLSGPLPNLYFLDLQRNKIVGTIPDCWGYVNFLIYINLSSNNLSGNIPKSMRLLSGLRSLRLSNNSLQGPILDFTSTYLEFLDLGENKLVGSIPSNWSKTSHPKLQMIRLRGNQVDGVIPSTLCSLPWLQFLDLAHNHLTGGLPHCFGHFVGMVSAVNHTLDENLDPRDASVMVVLKGAELQYTTTLEYVINLDLSCNNLTGSIPEEIANLSSLIGLNLSHNHLTGTIPDKIGEMVALTSLDLSKNNISGTIPSSISDLTSLESLNLSHNHLHGQIPTGRQLQTLEDPSAYEGNSGLCGDPLPNNCETSHDHDQPEQEQDEPDKKHKIEKIWFYFDIFSGFATGFWVIVGSLSLKRRFRFAFFDLVDRITDYFYVQVMIRINRFKN